MGLQYCKLSIGFRVIYASYIAPQSWRYGTEHIDPDLGPMIWQILRLQSSKLSERLFSFSIACHVSITKAKVKGNNSHWRHELLQPTMCHKTC